MTLLHLDVASGAQSAAPAAGWGGPGPGPVWRGAGRAAATLAGAGPDGRIVAVIVDSHHHLWTADYPWLAEESLAPIRRDYTVTDLRERIGPAGVDGTVLVEAGLGELTETTRFLATADATPEILGVVGWVSFTDPHLDATLAGLRDGPGGRWLVGVRDQVQGVDDPGYLARPEVRVCLAAAGAAGLVVDLVVRRDQLPACASAVAATPGTAFVLDHLGKPRFDAEGLAEWRTLVTPLARCDNVVAKLSGLLSEAGPGWTVAAVAPFVHTAVELFGLDRVMIGSDWPVCELVASYGDTLAALDACLPELSPSERAAVFGGTAVRTYRLENPT
jgi:L-fuconolactonase